MRTTDQSQVAVSVRAGKNMSYRQSCQLNYFPDSFVQTWRIYHRCGLFAFQWYVLIFRCFVSSAVFNFASLDRLPAHDEEATSKEIFLLCGYYRKTNSVITICRLYCTFLPRFVAMLCSLQARISIKHQVRVLNGSKTLRFNVIVSSLQVASRYSRNSLH